MLWFIDSSALVKRYIREQGSDWLRREIDKHEVIIAQVTMVEVVAALCKRLRNGEISKFAFYQARSRFLTGLSRNIYKIAELSYPMITEAQKLAFSQNLRAYDAVQLASALAAIASSDKSRFVFITADSDLEAAARAEGLQTDNPLAH